MSVLLDFEEDIYNGDFYRGKPRWLPGGLQPHAAELLRDCVREYGQVQMYSKRFQYFFGKAYVREWLRNQMYQACLAEYTIDSDSAGLNDLEQQCYIEAYRMVRRIKFVSVKH
jgi:hypothetical protein